MRLFVQRVRRTACLCRRLCLPSLQLLARWRFVRSDEFVHQGLKLCKNNSISHSSVGVFGECDMFVFLYERMNIVAKQEQVSRSDCRRVCWINCRRVRRLKTYAPPHAYANRKGLESSQHRCWNCRIWPPAAETKLAGGRASHGLIFGLNAAVVYWTCRRSHDWAA